MRSFLDRVWRLVVDERSDAPTLCAAVQDKAPNDEQNRVLHRTIREVTNDIAALEFNTAIARMMEFVNYFTKQDERPRAAMESFVLLLSPFAPHIAEELWRVLGRSDTLAYEPWPEFDLQLVAQEVVTIPVQVGGKVRDRIEVPRGTPESRVRELVLERERVRKFMGGRTLKKLVYVQDRLVNLVLA